MNSFLYFNSTDFELLGESNISFHKQKSVLFLFFPFLSAIYQPIIYPPTDLRVQVENSVFKHF